MSADQYLLQDKDGTPVYVEEKCANGTSPQPCSDANHTLMSSNEASKPADEKLSAFSLRILFLVILAAVLVVLLIIIVVYVGSNAVTFCTTTDCVYEAGRHIAIMNRTLDPCQDFYNFSCQNWQGMYPPEPGVGKFGTFYMAGANVQKRLFTLLTSGEPTVGGQLSEGVQKAKVFLTSCMDMTQRNLVGSAPLVTLMKKIGGSDISPLAPLSPDWDVTNALSSTFAYGASAFFSLSVTVNSFNSSQNVIDLSSSANFFSTNEMLRPSPKYKKAFLEFCNSLGKLLGNSDGTAVTSICNDIWDLELLLSESKMSPVSAREPNLFYSLRTLGEMDADVLSNWELPKILKNVFQRPLPSTTPILVGDVNYFRQLNKILQKSPKKLQANYITFQILYGYARHLGDQFQTPYISKKIVISGQAIPVPLWKTCIASTSYKLKTETSALYADQFYTEDTKKQITKLVLEVHSSLMNSIKYSSWMDQNTIEEALRKARGILFNIGYPNNVFNVSSVDSNLANVNLDPSDYFGNVVLLNQHFFQTQLNRLYQPVDRRDSDTPSTNVNAYFSHTKVTMAILGGIMQYPFFDPRFHFGSNLGALGAVIGHELSHGFDSRGQRYDSQGNLRNWWSNETYRMFNDKMQCYRQQYGEYTMMGLRNPSNYTLAENVADNVGLRLSYNAYHGQRQALGMRHRGRLPGLNLSDEQLFFLSFAQVYCGVYTKAFASHSIQSDVHSVYAHRVLGALSNMPEFARAFNCHPGDTYYRQMPCTLW